MGSGPFRSPLLRTSRLISLPPGTEMFQFPGFASVQGRMTGIAPSRVAPFGHLGITACVPLPRASRSLPRPSSPPCAQASPTCLPSLDYKSRQAELRALPCNLPYQFSCTLSRVHLKLGKDSISHESIAGQKTRPTTHPLSFTFQSAVRDSTLRGEPCIVTAR